MRLQKSLQSCSQLTVLRNKIQIVSPSQALSVQSKVHTKTKATGRASGRGQTRVQKGAFFKSLQSHLVEIHKSNLSSTKLDLSVEIYQSWYSDEGRVTLPPHAVPRDEACVYIKRYCWRNLSQRPRAVTDSGRLGAGTQGAFGGLWVSLCWHCLQGPGVPNTLG